MNIIIDDFNDKYIVGVPSLRERLKLPLNNLEELTQFKSNHNSSSNNLNSPTGSSGSNYNNIDSGDITRSTLTSRSRASLNLTRVQFYKQLSARQPSNYVPIINPFNLITDDSVIKKKTKGIEKALHNPPNQQPQPPQHHHQTIMSKYVEENRHNNNTESPRSARQSISSASVHSDGLLKQNSIRVHGVTKKVAGGKFVTLPPAQNQNHNMLNSPKTNVPYVERMKKTLNHKFSGEEDPDSPKRRKEKPIPPLKIKRKKEKAMLITEEEIVSIPIETIPIKLRKTAFMNQKEAPSSPSPRRKLFSPRESPKSSREKRQSISLPVQHPNPKPVNNRKEKTDSPRSARVRTAPLNRNRSEEQLPQRPTTSSTKSPRKKRSRSATSSNSSTDVLEGVLDAWGDSGFEDFPDEPMITMDWSIIDLPEDGNDELISTRSKR